MLVLGVNQFSPCKSEKGNITEIKLITSATKIQRTVVVQLLKQAFNSTEPWAIFSVTHWLGWALLGSPKARTAHLWTGDLFKRCRFVSSVAWKLLFLTWWSACSPSQPSTIIWNGRPVDGNENKLMCSKLESLLELVCPLKINLSKTSKRSPCLYN